MVLLWTELRKLENKNCFTGSGFCGILKKIRKGGEYHDE